MDSAWLPEIHFFGCWKLRKNSGSSLPERLWRFGRLGIYSDTRQEFQATVNVRSNRPSAVVPPAAANVGLRLAAELEIPELTDRRL
jgi:hypothetical protein